MKKKIIFSFLLLSFPVFCQAGKDTISIKEHSVNFATYFNPESFLNNSIINEQFGMLNIKTDFFNDSSSIMMGTRMQLAGFYNQPFEDSRNSLLNPLYQSYIDSQKNKWIKEVLGAIQVGAVGILAYQHIKKYGLFKKKDD